MAWADVKTELDKVTTAVVIMQTSANATSVSNVLERVDAAVIQKDCAVLMVKIADIQDRANEEQELTDGEKEEAELLTLQKEKDVVVKTNFDAKNNGRVSSIVYESATLKKKITQTWNYIGDSGCKNRSLKIEAA